MFSIFAIVLFFILLLFILASSVYFLIRNNWVYKQRVFVLREMGYDEYSKLPSYDNMMYKSPFCWDVNKYLARQ